MQDLKKFEIPGVVRIEPGVGGLNRILITSRQATAEIYTNGAHITRFDPAGQSPVLWMSKSSQFAPGKPIRGGVPICFPWFGPKKDDPKAPAHGWARIAEWEIVSANQTDSTVDVELQLPGQPLETRYKVSVGQALRMQLDVVNHSNDSVTFEEALHTYLTVGDIKQVSIEGLGGAQYIDKMDGAKIKPQTDPKIRFTGETDRVYFDTQSTCIVHDPVLKRRIEIAKSGSNATVVWNPWINKAKAMPDFGDDEWPAMVCVETANAGPNAVRIQPGATHTMTATVQAWDSK